MSPAEAIERQDDEPVPVRLAATAFARPKIHIFCENGSTTAEAASVLEHQRLGADSIEISEGGLPAAIAAYERTASPELLVIETHYSPEQLFAALDNLAALCQEHTKLIIIGQINDVNVYRALLRRDISDYLVAPLAPGQLSASIRSALQPGSEAATGHMISVIGAKGGCGASTICHNLGWTLAEFIHADTTIADCNIPFGTLGLNFNQDAGHGLTGALAAGSKLDAAMLDKLLARCSDHLSLLTTTSLLNGAAGISPASVMYIASLLRQTARIALFDIPSGWQDWMRTLIEQSDDCIVVAEPDLVNLRNAKNLFDAIRTDHTNGRPPLLVMNKVGLPRRPEISVREFASALDVAPSLVVDFDARLFGMAANNGLMVGELSPRSGVTASFRRFANILAGQTASKTAGLAAGNPLKPLIDRISRQFAT
ncbi:MAG TPA: cellulose synthase operon protein YhjQ/BcsQ [Hyphomicrobiales bacterium]|nr:cellulose synthase operon protein YhjQ/BcsQ [Hyphomicrobiales bacterium]